jgi:hypothetical protein
MRWSNSGGSSETWKIDGIWLAKCLCCCGDGPIATKGFPKIIGAATASKKVAALNVLIVGLVCMLLFFSLEIATQ